MAAATVTGARLLDSSDDTVTVWATTAPVEAGTDVSEVQLEPSRIALDDAASESSYLPADSVPSGVFERDLGAGELVPVDALRDEPVAGREDLAIAVGPGDAPVDLAEGDLVDVYAVPDPSVGGPIGSGDADRVLRQVPVLTVRSGSALGDASLQVVLGIDGRGTGLDKVLGALAAGATVLVRVGG